MAIETKESARNSQEETKEPERLNVTCCPGWGPGTGKGRWGETGETGLALGVRCVRTRPPGSQVHTACAAWQLPRKPEAIPERLHRKHRRTRHRWWPGLERNKGTALLGRARRCRSQAAVNGTLVRCHTAPGPVVRTPAPPPRDGRGLLRGPRLRNAGCMAGFLSQVPGVLMPSQHPGRSERGLSLTRGSQCP